MIYEPTLQVDEYFGCSVIADLQAFKTCSDVIIANRKSDELVEIDEKVYTRDLSGVDD